MKKIVVTGGAGFIGSALTRELVSQGNDVVVVDDFSTSVAQGFGRKVIRESLGHGKWREILKKIGSADFFFHLAALPRIGRSVDQPMETHRANVDGTLEALEIARKLKVKKFIFASSSSVYGMQKKMPMTEEMNLTPISPYAVHKLIGEEYCRMYSRIYSLPTICLRLFNVYGPKMPTEGEYQLVFASWLEQIRNGKPLLIYGDGKQTRDFTFVTDVVSAFILTMGHSTTQGEALNICSGEETTINDLAIMFGGKVLHLPARRFEEKYKRGSFFLARKRLGWKPKVKINEGVEILIREWKIQSS